MTTNSCKLKWLNVEHLYNIATIASKTVEYRDDLIELITIKGGESPTITCYLQELPALTKWRNASISIDENLHTEISGEFSKEELKKLNTIIGLYIKKAVTETKSLRFISGN